MARICEAREVKIGDYLHPEGDTSNIKEVARITRCNLATDPWTGERHYTRHRVYFTDELGAAPGVEHRSDALIVAY